MKHGRSPPALQDLSDAASAGALQGEGLGRFWLRGSQGRAISGIGYVVGFSKFKRSPCPGRRACAGGHVEDPCVAPQEWTLGKLPTLRHPRSLHFPEHGGRAFYSYLQFPLDPAYRVCCLLVCVSMKPQPGQDLSVVPKLLWP